MFPKRVTTRFLNLIERKFYLGFKGGVKGHLRGEREESRLEKGKRVKKKRKEIRDTLLTSPSSAKVKNVIDETKEIYPPNLRYTSSRKIYIITEREFQEIRRCYYLNIHSSKILIYTSCTRIRNFVKTKLRRDVIVSIIFRAKRIKLRDIRL